jgi:hypothetical protein
LRLFVFFKRGNVQRHVSGLDDETKEKAKRRVIADFEIHDVGPRREAQIRREIEQKFESDVNSTAYQKGRFLREII